MTNLVIKMRSGDEVSWGTDRSVEEIRKWISSSLISEKGWLEHEDHFLRVSELASIRIVAGESA